MSFPPWKLVVLAEPLNYLMISGRSQPFTFYAECKKLAKLGVFYVYS